MSIFAPKIFIFTLITLFIFNTNSIGYAYSYSTFQEDNKQVIKLDQKDYLSYFNNYNSLNNIERFERIENINSNKSDFDIIRTTFSLIFTYLSEVLISLPFIFFIDSDLLTKFTYFSFYMILLSFFNGFFVFIIGENNYNKSLLITIFGSFVSMIAYLITSFIFVYIDSYKYTNQNDSGFTNFQKLITPILLPVIMTIGANIAYHLSTDSNKIDTRELEKRISETKKSYEAVSSKISISSSSISFNLVKF